MDFQQMLGMAWPILLMIVIFYFILYRPQKKQQSKRAQLLDSLKRGDRVVTIGGVYGKIVNMSQDSVTLQVADKVEMKFARTAISRHQNPEKDESGAQPEQLDVNAAQ